MQWRRLKILAFKAMIAVKIIATKSRNSYKYSPLNSLQIIQNFAALTTKRWEFFKRKKFFFHRYIHRNSYFTFLTKFNPGNCGFLFETHFLYF